MFLWSWSSVVVHGNYIQVTLEPDRPFQRVQISGTANLQCCYTPRSVAVNHTWIRSIHTINGTMSPELVMPDDRVTTEDKMHAGVKCHTLLFRQVQFNDSGLYQCLLNHSAGRPAVYSAGTYLQVYKPTERLLNISESTRNKILTAEGILLLLCLLVHGGPLLLKSKKLNLLEGKKMKDEDENIYEGLNLEDCCTAYDQIQHYHVPNPYQDVGNVMEEEEEIQLEKP
ncbi:B-cell antigen receptor complex-associated protein alpha chain [Diretmus argenteus]